MPSNAKADAIPYGAVHTPNATTYTFTAANSGTITAYFAGTNASYNEDLGLLVNGVDTTFYGLQNHSTALGASFDFGGTHVNAGDVLTFVVRVANLGNAKVYSNASLNAGFDSIYAPSSSFNHVYSTAYTATSPIIDSIPTGTYVAFEDLPASNPPDWNYFDETFVFTNVSSTPSTPLPGTVWVGIVLLAGFAGYRMMLNRQARLA